MKDEWLTISFFSFVPLSFGAKLEFGYIELGLFSEYLSPSTSTSPTGGVRPTIGYLLASSLSLLVTLVLYDLEWVEYVPE